jgi:excisionase family DNA binding protein
LDRYFTTSEVSQALNVHSLTVRNWIWSGKLKAVKLAGLRFRRVRERDLKRILKGK